MQNRWGCISGYLENDEDFLSRALIEISEETGIESHHIILQKILNQTEVNFVNDTTFVIQPFCFITNTVNIILDWEHVDYKWIEAWEIGLYDLVPKLDDLIKCCLND